MALISFILGAVGIIAACFIPSYDAAAGIFAISAMLLFFAFKWSSRVR